MSLDFIKDLGEDIKDELTPTNKMKTISKADFSENLTILKDRVTTLHRTLSSVMLNDRKTLAASIFKAVSDRNNIACATYMNIARSIGKSDTTIAFDSAIFISNNYISLITLIEKNVAMILKEKELTLYNTKVSHLAIFGLVREIELFTDYTVYLCDGITNEVCQHNGVKELPPPKQYRLAKLTKKQAEYIDICRARLTNTANSIMMEVNKITTNLDVNLVAEDNTINTGFIRFDKISPMLRSALSIGSRKLLIFRWFGEQWELLKYAKYQKAKKEKEWLEAHVALLQLDAQGVDPNSDEYRRLVKVIESYNEMIAGLDQKIDSYVNEE